MNPLEIIGAFVLFCFACKFIHAFGLFAMYWVDMWKEQ